MLHLANIIETEKGLVLYDSVIHKFVIIDEYTRDIILNDEFRNRNKDKYIEILRKNKIRDVTEPKEYKIKYYLSEYELKDYLQRKMMHMVLALTENCNFRCKYCTYHSKYEVNYKCEEMSIDTAQKAIDYFLSHSIDSNTVYIGFYGGEPLIEFEILKECVSYAKRKAMGQNIRFTITTNGLLLENLNIQNFLIDNDFLITISLDGPESLHDRYRKDVFGNKTYNRIITCLRDMYKKNSFYFEQNVMINTVISPPYDYELLYDYIDNLSIGTQLINVTLSSYFDNYLKENRINKDTPSNYNEITNKYLSTNNQIIKVFLENLKRYHNLIQARGDEFTVFPSGPCIPTVRKVFVRTNGDFFLCEKVDEKNPMFKMGNVNEGIDINRINNLISKYIEVVKEKCRTCWAIRFCKLCYANIYSIKNNKSTCANLRTSIENDVKNYYKFIYENTTNSELLDNMTII